MHRRCVRGYPSRCMIVGLRFLATRVICPFLRPFLPRRRRRGGAVRGVAEIAVAAFGGAWSPPKRSGRRQMAHRPGAQRRRDPGWRRWIPAYATTSTAGGAPTPSSSRTRSSSPSTTRSRRRGFGYSQLLAELFRRRADDVRLPRAVSTRALRADRSRAMLQALLASYQEWGGNGPSPPAHRHRRLAARCRRSASSRSCAMAFIALGVPTVHLRSPAIWSSPPAPVFFGRHGTRASTPRGGSASIWSTARVLINDILAPRDRVPRAARRLPQPDRLRRQLAALQDPAQESLLRRADRRALPRVVLPRGARDDPPACPVDGRWWRRGG